MTTNDSIYLCAPVNALVEGLFEQNVPLAEIKQHGDFGLGTFNDLDGEMVLLDGAVYQITAAGQVHVIEDEQTRTPFACVTNYRPISHDELDQELTYDAFLDWLVRLLPSPNLFYALRIEGEFASIKARSVPKQENYRTLVEVAREQALFQFDNASGTLVGFFTPTFMASLSVPGLHLHFLSADFRSGGHLLECRPRKVRVGVQFISRLELALPLSLDYLTWDFRRDTRQDLHQAER
ncbi:MAG TPA: acetolactate decarboxylase [Candidatus Anammoximicrobium sp.]|nr:acetolactate decarboxylase [Candidatus Anammoximicrobium sp.]